MVHDSIPFTNSASYLKKPQLETLYTMTKAMLPIGVSDFGKLIRHRDPDGNGYLQTWYDFDGTNYFTFGKVSNLSENHAINITASDYLVGEYGLDINEDSFSVSSWIKCSANASDRTIMAAGEKFQ